MTREPHAEVSEPAPRARVRRRRWGVSVIWTVPLVSAVVAGYLVYGRVREFGPTITLAFPEGGGIRSGQTPLRYRGVTVGEVSGVELGPALRSVRVRVRLRRSAAGLARDGSMFWIVSPETGLADLAGLRTVLTGPEIRVHPGGGELRTEFTGLDAPPVGLGEKGLVVRLRAPRLGAVRPNSPVYHRGVEAGVVQETALSPDASAVEIRALIRHPYARLVRANSVFWNASGVRVTGGLFDGVDVRVESLRALATGGVAFATPDAPGKPAADGAVFSLADEPEDRWLEWAPKIPSAEGGRNTAQAR